MARPEYRVITLDLAQARPAPGERIVDAGVKYDALSVLAMPAGAVVSMRLYDNADPIPLAVGDSYDFSAVDSRGCIVPVDEGIRIENQLSAGLLVLLVSYGTARETAA